MFESIKQWVRERVKKMFRFADISDLIPFATPMSGAMTQAIELWMDMYMDNPQWKSKDVYTMNLPSLIAAELSRIATVEMESEVVGTDRQAQYLNEQYQQVIRNLRKLMEYAAAGGSLALKPYLSGDQIVVDFIRAGMFWPTAYSENGRIIGCSFLDQTTRGDKVYIKIEAQTYDPKTSTCTIESKAYITDETTHSMEGAQEVPLTTVDTWADIEPEVTISGVTRPLFSIINMPLANTIEPGVPLGVSCYSRATDLIKQADIMYSNVLWEMESGKRAVYVDIRAFKPGDTRNPDGTLPFKRLYRYIDNPQEQTLFQEWSPTLREQNYLNALDDLLRRIEDTCCLARGTLSNKPDMSAKTATELKIMRQRTYAVCTDMQRSAEDALRDLVDAMSILMALRDGRTNAPAIKYEVTFDWDDSVVSDRDAQFQEWLLLLDRRLVPETKFLEWYFGLDEKAAQEMLDQARGPMDNALNPMTGMPMQQNNQFGTVEQTMPVGG